MRWETVFSCLMIFAGVIGLVVSTFTFSMMYHNVDLTVNACVLYNDLNNWEFAKNSNTTFDFRDLKDAPSLGEDVVVSDMFIYSMNRIIGSFFAAILSTFVFGIGIYDIISKNEVNK